MVGVIGYIAISSLGVFVSEPITSHHFATPRRGKPKIIAIFSFPYEAHLVPALLENIRPFVHGYACWDDRTAGPTMGGEPTHLPHIRLIDIPERLFVGAARDIGIDASRAPQIAFLAGDCVARPGWVSGRVARHSAGVLMVSSAVQPDAPRRITAIVMQALYFRARDPRSPADSALHFGRSYARNFQQQAGYFPPGLRIAEDEHFNRRTDRLARPVWAGDVACSHPAARSIICPSFSRREGLDQRSPELKHAKAAVALSSQDIRYDLLHAQVLAALNRGDEALAVCAIARDLGQTNVALLREAAAVARRMGGPGAALAEAERSLLVSSTRHAVLLTVAELARDADCIDLAFCLAQRALVFAPNAPDVHDLLADLHQAAGDLTGAQHRSRMVKALRDTAEAMALLGNK